MWHVYILKCSNGSLYTGITNNMERRFEEHVSGKGGHFTRSHGALKILYNEKYSDKIPRSLINSFNNYRNERHDILYGFESYSGKEDAENAVITSEDFLFKIKEILGDS